MEPILIWVDEPQSLGWGCSNCAWRFPVPPFLGDPEAKRAYDRLALARFHEHRCDLNPLMDHLALNSSKELTFQHRVRRLLKVGYRPKDAVAFALEEIALEHRKDPAVMEHAKAEAEDFLWKLRQGLT
ncbi:MAG: hypothetical protein WAQ52_00975 [Terriglobales bacterium]